MNSTTSTTTNTKNNNIYNYYKNNNNNNDNVITWLSSEYKSSYLPTAASPAHTDEGRGDGTLDDRGLGKHISSVDGMLPLNASDYD